MASDDMNVGDDVRKAIAEGRRVQEAVRDITLKALTRHELDQRALRKVTKDAMDAVRDAAAVQGASVTQAAKDAVGGVDQALAHAAQALKLSLDEAASRAGKFTQEDLARAKNDLADLEKMFLDTLRDTAQSASGTASAMFEDLGRHARSSGTAIGRQLAEMAPLAERMAQAGQAQFEAGMHAAATSGALFARAAAGVLAGIADTLSGKHKGPPG
ncbi:MAG: DUF6781 family protein [Burkholderiales bacterium]